MMHYIAVAHQCPATDHLCRSGNVGLGAALLVLIIYLLLRKKR